MQNEHELDESTVPTMLYRVRPGDDLRSIAAQFYGRPDFWVFIFLANPGDIHGLRDLPPGKPLCVPILPHWGESCCANFADSGNPEVTS